MAPPAPWKLSGSAFVVYVRGGRRWSSRIVMLVRYTSSPVGRYDEILYCRRRRFGSEGKWHVDPIFVDSPDSVEGGRDNWGLPKGLASFEVRDDAAGTRARVASPESGAVLAKIHVRGLGPSVPVSSRVMPARWLSFAQFLGGVRYDFAPQLSGRVRLARLVELELREPFPVLSSSDVRAVLHLPHFEARFPVALTRPEAG